MIQTITTNKEKNYEYKSLSKLNKSNKNTTMINNYVNNTNGKDSRKGTFDQINTILKSQNNSININYKTFIKGKNYNEFLKDYDILDHLGIGAFGVIQKVQHKISKQKRAMKIILKLYQYYYDNNNIYIITEFCQGGELFDKIKEKNGSFNEKDAAKIIKIILKAIAYCHSMKLVHSYLKPENILLEGNDIEHIKLIDFGTSCLISPNKKFKELLGTAYYIAPEVLKKNYDEKCDLWSIGVKMFILLIGQPPFNGKNDDEIMKNVKKGYIDSYLFDEISSDAKDLLKKLLEVNPSKRYSAIEALEHPLIKNIAPKSIIKSKTAKKVFNNFIAFHAEQKMQEAVIAFIVNQLVSKEETEEIRKIFIELDTNVDGLL